MSVLICSKCALNERYINSSWCKDCINTRKRELRHEKKAKGISLYGENRKKTCNKCKGLKEDNYMNDSLCQYCRSETNKDKRILARAKAGKRLWGKGRKITCSTCGELKGPHRENESRCKKCKLQSLRDKRAKKRVELGLPPYGSGRSEFCCKCGIKKERIKSGYCNSCKAKNESESRFKRVATEQGKKRERLLYAIKALDPEFRLKKRARDILNRKIAQGELIKKICSVCGSEKSEAHHEDYSSPLDVIWLCRKHHVEYHSTNFKEA